MGWSAHGLFQVHKYHLQLHWTDHIVQELCESRGGRPGLSVLMNLMVSVDVKQCWTMLTHWSQLVPNMSIWHPRTLSNTWRKKNWTDDWRDWQHSTMTRVPCLCCTRRIFNTGKLCAHVAQGTRFKKAPAANSHRWQLHTKLHGSKEELEMTTTFIVSWQARRERRRSSFKANNVIISTTHLVHTAKALSFSPWYLYRSANACKRPYLVSHSTQSWRSHPVSTATKVSSSGELVSAYNLSSATSISWEWKKTKARLCLILGRRKTEALQIGCWHTNLKKRNKVLAVYKPLWYL